jgi:signal transduction histidine kinase/DNA-binding response OmpR family regulator
LPEGEEQTMPNRLANAARQADLAFDSQLLSAINTLNHNLLNERNTHLMVSSSLHTVLEATESQCSALAELVSQNFNHNVLRICSVLDRNQAYHSSPKIIDLPTAERLFGNALFEGHTTTGEFSDLEPVLPILFDTVAGNSPYLAVPLMAKNKFAGVLVLAGRPSGYPPAWQKAVSALFSGIHMVLAHYQGVRKRFIERHKLKSTQRLLLNTLRHEIRTPINGILGLCSLLEDTDLTTQQQHFVESVRNSASNLLPAVNDMLEQRRKLAARIEVYEQMFDLIQLIEDLIALETRVVSEKGIELKLKYPPEMQRHYFGDATKIRHILTNLVRNAIKYTQHGGVTIELSTNRAGEVEIAVRDTGIGIEPELLLEIFQINKQTKGVGLLINRTLAKQLGGDIEINSIRHMGSVFTLRAPLKSPNENIDHDNSLFQPPQFPERRILLVEDDLINQNLTVSALSRLGCHIDVAADGHEALQMYKTRHYDLILMDCRMPKMDGYASTRKIREVEVLLCTKRVPIVALTANNQPENRDKCLEVGMDDYLSKPVQLSVMRNVVQMYLNRNTSNTLELDEEDATPQDLRDQLHKPNLGILSDMFGKDLSLIQSVLKHYRGELTEQREFLQLKGRLLNKKEFGKYVEMMKGCAAYSGYNNFAAYLAGLEYGIYNGSVPTDMQIVNELISIIDRVIQDNTLLPLKKSEVV